MQRFLLYLAFLLFSLSLIAVGQEKVPSILTVQRGPNSFEIQLFNSGDSPLTNIRAALRGIDEDIWFDTQPIDRLNPGERATVSFSVWVDHSSSWKEKRASIEVSSAEVPTYYGDIILQLTATISSDFHLAPAFPNPFNSSTNIFYRLPPGSENQETSLAIYDIRGRKIKTLVRQKQHGGEYRIPWDGTDNTNSPVASGMYYLRLSSGSFHSITKIILTK